MNGKGRLDEQENGERERVGEYSVSFCPASSLPYSGNDILMSFKEPPFPLQVRILSITVTENPTQTLV